LEERPETRFDRDHAMQVKLEERPPETEEVVDHGYHVDWACGFSSTAGLVGAHFGILAAD